jgi:iron complex outermembrane receptor protein
MIASTRKTYSRSLSPAFADGFRPALPRNLYWPATPARLTLQLLALACTVGALPVATLAQTNSVDLTTLPLEALMNLDVPTVYGASRLEQKTTEAPSSVTIVTSDEIKKYGYRTLADVLGSVQGFYVSYDRNYSFVGVRGVSLGDFNDRILLLVDGHQVNNDFNDGAFVGTGFILDLDLVDRVEIIRGPGAAVYGNNAFFGVVNVITRQGKQLNGVEASGEYGSFDAYKLRASYGKLFTNGVQLLVSGTYYDNPGQDQLFYKEFNTPAQNNGIAQDMDADKYVSTFGSLGYGDFTLQGAYNYREKINPTAQFTLTTFNDPRLETKDQQSYVELKYAHSFPEIVDVTARVHYDNYSHEIGYPQSLLVNDQVVFSRFSSERDLGEWWGTELQLNKRLWDRHVLTLGADYRDDFMQSSQVLVPAVPAQGSETRMNRQSYGVYAQGDFAVLTNLHLIGGVRFDKYGEFDPSVDPRIALIYHPMTTSTLKAIYGTAFRAPSFYELASSSQALEPERITGYELVYEQEWGAHLRSSVSGYYNDMRDLIVFSSGGFTNFDAQAKGLEFALEGFWASGISGRASYSLQDTRNSSFGWEMPDSPAHLVKLNVTVPVVRDKLFAGVEFQFTSDRKSLHYTTDINGQPITVQGETASGFSIINFTLFSQKIVKNLEFSASVYNLLDTRYSDPASQFHVQDLIEQDGRTFRLKLTYRF